MVKQFVWGFESKSVDKVADLINDRMNFRRDHYPENDYRIVSIAYSYTQGYLCNKALVVVEETPKEV
jgi:hypothetical protein